MNLSKRSEYALRALIDLGIADRTGSPHPPGQRTRVQGQLPIKFLEQILTQLRVGGYVETTRGKLGGIRSRNRSQIKIGASFACSTDRWLRSPA
jgi:DNA-binding IscR family transcriptional regulator